MKVTADDIAQLLASTPPRLVPAHVVKAARKRGNPLAGAIAGFIFMAIGTLFTVIFFPTHIVDDWRLSGSGAATTSGTVVAVTRTNMQVNKRHVMDTTFTFTPPGEKPHTADCYSTGARWSIGENVTVRYLPGDTALACIEGGRLNQVGWGGIFVLLFPLLGAAIAIGTIREHIGLGRALREGLTAEVDVQSVDRTNMKINNQTVYRITLSPLTPGGRPAEIKRRDPAEIEQFRNRMADKQPLFALYDPRKPSRIIFPETLIDP